VFVSSLYISALIELRKLKNLTGETVVNTSKCKMPGNFEKIARKYAEKLR
jgi:hypothetical protein